MNHTAPNPSYWNKCEGLNSANTLQSLISSDPILASFFQTHTADMNGNSDDGIHWKIAHELMLDGIRYRATQAHPNKIKRETNMDF